MKGKITNLQKSELIKALDSKIREAKVVINDNYNEYYKEFEKNPPEIAKKLASEYIKVGKRKEEIEEELVKTGFKMGSNYNAVKEKYTFGLSTCYENVELVNERKRNDKKHGDLDKLTDRLRLEIAFADSDEDAMKYLKTIDEEIKKLINN